MIPGNKVNWTTVSKRNGVITMKLNRGYLQEIRGDIAVVKGANSKRTTKVPLAEIRPVLSPSLITDFVNAMRDLENEVQ